MIRKLQTVEYYDRNGVLRLTLNRYPYYVNTAAFKSWAWGYSQTYGKVEYFYRAKDEYDLEIGISGDSLAARDNLCDIFNADVLAGEPGTLKIRGWALKCYILEAEYSFSLRLDRKAKFKLKAATPGWTRHEVYHFDGTEGHGAGTDLGRNYSFNDNILGRGYDYGYDEYAAHAATIKLAGSDNGYEAVIYGPATDPVIYINNNPIKINISINSNERIRIVSDGSIRTIEILQLDGSSENAFVYRDKEHSPFITLKQENEINFGNIKFDFSTIERRSEPSWI